MTRLQKQAIEMIQSLSDDDVRFLIEVMQRLQTKDRGTEHCPTQKERELAFQSLDAARIEIREYFPADFDPDRELKEAKYGRY